MGYERLLGDWVVRRAALAGSFSATPAAGVTVQKQVQRRALRPGPRRFTDEVRAAVELRLKKGWTPELISGRARLEGGAMVCKESIYQHIYCDAKAGGDLWTCLPRARRKRRRRCPRQQDGGGGRFRTSVMINTRPAEVETRKSVGHWEGDLINGVRKTGHLSTLVERCTRLYTD